VVAIPDPVRDQAIKAFVIVKDGGATTAAELIAWCRERLSPFKVPEIVEFRDVSPAMAGRHCQAPGPLINNSA